ncbi:MAG: hypothetical protein ACJ71L_00130 [Nitrososphaeraceae archaeon]
MAFKDLKKKVSLEIIQQQFKLLDVYKTNHFGYGILKNTSKKTSKQMEIAALIILLVYPRRTEMISLSIIMKE